MKISTTITAAAMLIAAVPALAQSSDTPTHYTAAPVYSTTVIPFAPGGGTDDPSVFDMDWNTFNGGGGPLSGGAGLLLEGTIGQPDAGPMSGGGYELVGGYWGLTDQPACYANCDGSTSAPALNVNDFACFLNAFAAGLAYANCDGSTSPPVLNVNDFSCFLNAFAAGCP